MFVRFQKGIQTAFGWLKPNLVAAGHAPKVLETIKKEGFVIDNHCLMQLTIEQAKEFYVNKKGTAEYENIIKVMTSGPVLALQLTRKNAISVSCIAYCNFYCTAYYAGLVLLFIANSTFFFVFSFQHWKMCCGPTDPEQARWSHPKSLRALYGEDILQNACHGSEEFEQAQRECHLVFHEFKEVCDTFAWIKPKAVSDGHSNAILTRMKDDGYTTACLLPYYYPTANLNLRKTY